MNSINEYQLRLDVQRFLWSVYYIGLYYAGPLSCILRCNNCTVNITSLRLQCSILAQYITQGGVARHHMVVSVVSA